MKKLAIFAMAVASMLLAPSASVGGLYYGALFAKETDSGSYFTGGGRGKILVTREDGSTKKITDMRFTQRGYAYAYVNPLYRYAETLPLQIEATFNVGDRGQLADVSIQTTVGAFLDDLESARYSFWLGSYVIDVEYDTLPDMVDTAKANGSFTTLLAALEATGLDDALRGDGPFTVFAPTDDAFAALPEGTVDSLLGNLPALTDILLYHVLGEERDADAVTADEAIETLLGKDIAVTVVDGRVFINNAEVVLANVQTSNGIIHVINQVLLPPTLPDIVDLAAGAGIFNTLGTALELTGLDEVLRGEGPFTVFAPTDEAFLALPEGVLASLVENPDALADILLYHVAPGRLNAAAVVGLNELTTASGQDVHIRVEEDGSVFINDAQVLVTDLKAENGIVHVIDAVLIPKDESDVVDTAIGAGSFQTLVAALEATGLDEVLRGDGPFTVFAPTDEAFAALPEGVLEKLLAKPHVLRYVLLYHVINDDLAAEAVLSNRYLKTALGSWVRINQNDQGAFVNNSQIVATDIDTSNGTIHVIDQVLLPWWVYWYL